MKLPENRDPFLPTLMQNHLNFTLPFQQLLQLRKSIECQNQEKSPRQPSFKSSPKVRFTLCGILFCGSQQIHNIAGPLLQSRYKPALPLPESAHDSWVLCATSELSYLIPFKNSRLWAFASLLLKATHPVKAAPACEPRSTSSSGHVLSHCFLGFIHLLSAHRGPGIHLSPPSHPAFLLT